MINAKLLELLVCPVTKGRLEYDRENDQLVSRQAKLAFPILDDVPNMQLATAISLGENEISADQETQVDEESQ